MRNSTVYRRFSQCCVPGSGLQSTHCLAVPRALKKTNVYIWQIFVCVCIIFWCLSVVGCIWLFPKGRININTDDNFSVLNYVYPQILEFSIYSGTFSRKSCFHIGKDLLMVSFGEGEWSRRQLCWLWCPVVFPTRTFSWEREQRFCPLCWQEFWAGGMRRASWCVLGAERWHRTLLCTPQLSGSSRGQSSASAP